MKILIDIGHPAHVHLFRNFASEMLADGNEVLFTCREKEFEKYLLSYYGFSYKSFGKKYKSFFGKLLGLIEFDFKEYRASQSFKPDIFLSHGSIYAAHASFLSGKPHIALEDTFNFEQIRLYKPFTDAILTSDYSHPLCSGKVIRYSGYHELAYLHPKRFTPDSNVLRDLGINPDEKFTIIRFVSWSASHDIGHKGLSIENKLKAVKTFQEFGRVFISSEGELPPELSDYKLTIPPHLIHDLIAYASLLFGESSTMAEEAAILGTPAIYLYDKSTFYTLHLQNEYQLMYNFSESPDDELRAIQKGIDILSSNDAKSEWKKKSDRLLSEKIDVTSFLVWFVKNWPDSFKIMKENPGYQERFK